MLGEKKDPLSIPPEFDELSANHRGIRLECTESLSLRVGDFITVEAGAIERSWHGVCGLSSVRLYKTNRRCKGFLIRLTQHGPHLQALLIPHGWRSTHALASVSGQRRRDLGRVSGDSGAIAAGHRSTPYLPPNPHRPRAFGGKGVEWMKKGFPSSNPSACLGN